MPGFGRAGRPSKSLTLAILILLSAIVAWIVGYAYLVKIAGYPSGGFFTTRMALGLVVISFIAFVIFRLRGFFKNSS
jgi:hypothetical protein